MADVVTLPEEEGVEARDNLIPRKSHDRRPTVMQSSPQAQQMGAVAAEDNGGSTATAGDTTTATATTTVATGSRANGAPREPEIRRNLRVTRVEDMYSLVGAAIGGVSLSSLLYFVVAPLSGAVGFVVLSYVCFITLYALVVWIESGKTQLKDKLAGAVIHSFTFLLFLGLVLVVVYTVIRGLQALPRTNFFTEDMSNAGPLEPLTVGGLIHGVVGTLEQITIALLVTVPLGVACAVFLNEVPGRFSRFVRTIAEAMTALPSIVAGLFIYATLILIVGMPKSGFAAAMAISVMMLPIIIRAADVVIRLVPGNLKEASYALGASQWQTVRGVVLPTARSGLMTAVILGTARGIGETSPVLLTAGFTAALNANPLNGPQVSLPLLTFELVRSPQPSYIVRGFGTAAVLLALVLTLFVFARILGGRAPGDLSPRQRRRVAAESRRDAARIAGTRQAQRDRDSAQDLMTDLVGLSTPPT